VGAGGDLNAAGWPGLANLRNIRPFIGQAPAARDWFRVRPGLGLGQFAGPERSPAPATRRPVFLLRINGKAPRLSSWGLCQSDHVAGCSGKSFGIESEASPLLCQMLLEKSLNNRQALHVGGNAFRSSIEPICIRYMGVWATDFQNQSSFGWASDHAYQPPRQLAIVTAIRRAAQATPKEVPLMASKVGSRHGLVPCPLRCQSCSCLLGLCLQSNILPRNRGVSRRKNLPGVFPLLRAPVFYLAKSLATRADFPGVFAISREITHFRAQVRECTRIYRTKPPRPRGLPARPELSRTNEESARRVSLLQVIDERCTRPGGRVVRRLGRPSWHLIHFRCSIGVREPLAVAAYASSKRVTNSAFIFLTSGTSA
jgi:hypothetical protein